MGLTTQIGDRTYMGVSVLTRMAVGLAVFVLLARGLGPAQYGLFSTVYAYAVIAGFVTDFGYSVRALRDIAALPARGAQAIAESLSVKRLLMLVVGIVGGVAVLFLPIDRSAKAACLLLGAAVLASSVGDLSLVAFRSLGQYSKESGIVLWTSALHGLIVTGLVLANAGIVAIGVGYLVSRVIYMAAALLGVRRLFPGERLQLAGFRSTLALLRRSTSWALDSGLGFLNGQIDALIIPQMLGLASAGVYQSGGRFVQAGLGLAAILSNVHIPRLAGAATLQDVRRRELRVIAEFAAVGVVFAAAVLVGGPVVRHVLLGPGYAAVDQLWPGFAAFLLVRYVAAGFGVVLSAQARPLLRVVAQSAGLLAVVTAFIVFLPRHGLSVAPWIMTVGAAVTSLVYLFGFLVPATDRARS